MKKVSACIAITMIALSVLLILVASTYPAANQGVPGPGFFPTLLGIGVIALSFGQLLVQRHEADIQVRLFCKENVPVFITMGLLVVYFLVLKYLGFRIATPLFLIAVMRLFQVKKWSVCILTAVLTTVCTYLVFSTLLSVQLPYGIF